MNGIYVLETKENGEWVPANWYQSPHICASSDETEVKDELDLHRKAYKTLQFRMMFYAGMHEV